MSPDEAFQQAVTLAGGQTKFGAVVGASQQRVWNLLKAGKAMPAEWVLAAERATGLSRYEIRPDIYPPDEELPEACAVGE